ncbi:hypothetical protein GCM10025790_00510 [Nesterenkonia rhizosphaerae]|uniref:Lipocalin-like domain-containing protein n=1 Tax=Nesterenkonia rhizosphaerae TaxID=1348272 RepID=A0ABP9FNC0_9MICC
MSEPPHCAGGIESLDEQLGGSWLLTRQAGEGAEHGFVLTNFHRIPAESPSSEDSALAYGSFEGGVVRFLRLLRLAPHARKSIQATVPVVGALREESLSPRPVSPHPAQRLSASACVLPSSFRITAPYPGWFCENRMVKREGVREDNRH